MDKINKSETKVHGLHILTICDASSNEAKKLERAIEDVKRRRDIAIRLKLTSGFRELWEEYRFYVDLLHKLFKKRETAIENITTTVGRSVLAQRLGGDTTYTGIVNYTALGTDATPPFVADATLGTETYRKGLSSGTDANNIAYLETFFTAAEVNGTFEEYGNFIDGAAGADTGQLFNRFTTTVTKSAVETLNVQSIITFNDA